MKYILRIILLLVFFSILIIACRHEKSSEEANLGKPDLLPPIGIYDGNIGGRNFILIIEKSDTLSSYGFYVLDQNQAIEKKITVTFSIIKQEMVLSSALFDGKITGNWIDGIFQGKFYSNKTTFWSRIFPKNESIVLIKRDSIDIHASKRYQKAVFSTVKLTPDIKYGNAKGRWITSPYLDDPLIDIVSRGMLNYFKKEEDLDLFLDVYEPVADTLPRRPLVLLIHGGAFYMGKKDDITVVNIANELVKYGYVVASIDYRIGFKMKAEDMAHSGFQAVQDAHAALRYLSHNADKYHIDPNCVFVGGMSSGAITALNLAFLDNNEFNLLFTSKNQNVNFGKIEESGNKLTNKFEIQGVASMWGAVTDTSIIDSDERIPVIMFHGTDDHIVPYGYDFPFQNTLKFNRLFLDKIYGSKMIHERLDHLKIKNKLIPFEGKGHEPQLDNFRKINSNLTVIEKEIEVFFFDINKPQIIFDRTKQNFKSDGQTVFYDIAVQNGKLVQIIPQGGVLTGHNKKGQGVIWFEGLDRYVLEVYATNSWDAWTVKKFTIDNVKESQH